MNLGDFLALGMDEQRRILDAASRQSRSKALLDRIAELEGMLSTCEDAINSLDEDALGYANDGDHEWPNRDELLSDIERVLSNDGGDAHGNC